MSIDIVGSNITRTLEFPRYKRRFPLDGITAIVTDVSIDFDRLEMFVNTGRFSEKPLVLLSFNGTVYDDYTDGEVTSDFVINNSVVIPIEEAKELERLIGLMFGFINDRGLPLTYWFAYLYDEFWRRTGLESNQPAVLTKDYIEEFYGCLLTPGSYEQIETKHVDVSPLLGPIDDVDIVCAGGSVLGSLVGTDYGDIDLFVVSNTDTINTREFASKMYKRIRSLDNRAYRFSSLYVNSYIVGFVLGDNDMHDVQIIKRRYPSVLSVLVDFDLDCVRCAIDANGNYYATPTFFWSIARKVNVVNPQFRTYAFGNRLAKYRERGFSTFVTEHEEYKDLVSITKPNQVSHYDEAGDSAVATKDVSFHYDLGHERLLRTTFRVPDPVDDRWKISFVSDHVFFRGIEEWVLDIFSTAIQVDDEGFTVTITDTMPTFQVRYSTEPRGNERSVFEEIAEDDFDPVDLQEDDLLYLNFFRKTFVWLHEQFVDESILEETGKFLRY